MRSTTKVGGPQIDQQQMAAVGLRAFQQISSQWHLSVNDQLRLLGAPSRSSFFAWRRDPERATLSRDTIERLSNIVGIYKSLQILFVDPKRADEWIRKPNVAPIFGSRSALDRMLAGNVSDLDIVRRYLHSAQEGGWS